MRLDEMYYTEIEMEWMKEILRDKEEEIKKLKEERDNFMLKYSKAVEEKILETNKLCTERNKLEQENKKLKAENEYRNKIVDIIPQDEKSVAEETIQDLQERIRFLEQCLDNKEKVNKSLREENKRLSDFLECEA